MRPVVPTAAIVILSAAVVLTAAEQAPKPKTHSVTGIIEAYDAAAHTLTLKTSKGSTVYKLAADTKVWQGSKSVTEDQIAGALRSKAKVKYTETDGVRTASSLRVTNKSP